MHKTYFITTFIIILFISTLPLQAYHIQATDHPTQIWIIDINGNGDYTSIQTAINHAHDGDNIIIHPGIYQESLTINKTLTIKGADKKTTIIQGTGFKDVISITKDHVSLSDVTIKNSGPSGRDAGIQTIANYTTITDTIIEHTTIGIFLTHSNNHIIKENIIYQNKDYGIHLYESRENTIQHNIITENRWGILLVYGSKNTIANNTIINNDIHGLWLLRGSNDNMISHNHIISNNDTGVILRLFCSNNTISQNTISTNTIGISIGLHWACNTNYIQRNTINNNTAYGIILADSSDNKITANNFQANTIHATFSDCTNQQWNHNNWDTNNPLFYIIKGTNHHLPWFNIDAQPNTNTIEIAVEPLPLTSIPSQKNKSIQTTQINIPPEYIWTNVNGTDYTSPVKNQMPSPTCEAYAMCASLETMIHYQLKENIGFDLSETHLFYYSGGTAQWGVDATEPAEYLITHGVPDEGCFPDPHRPYDFAFNSIQGWENRTIKITEWGWVNNDIESIKKALITYGPLTICQMTRKDLDFYKEGVYMPKLSSSIQRGHVTCIVGYDDANHCFIIRNSAGETWGEQGYFRISYEGFQKLYSFIYPFYGGTGILYLDGIYGTMQQTYPKITITKPDFYHTYLFEKDIKTLLPTIKDIQTGAPRILGPLSVQIKTENTDSITIYIDNQLEHTHTVTSDYTWSTTLSKGLHTLEIKAFNDNDISSDIIDVYIL